MNTKEKYKFICDLIDSISGEITAKIPSMPEEWDGIELRQYVADSFAEKAGAMSFRSGVNRDKKRLREYRNTALVKNL